MVWSTGLTLFFCTWILVVQAPFFENIILSPLKGFYTLVQSQRTINEDSQFSSMIYLSFLIHLAVFITVALQEILKSRGMSPPILFFIFKNDLANLGPLHFRVNFRINSSISAKKGSWNFERLYQICRLIWEVLPSEKY